MIKKFLSILLFLLFTIHISAQTEPKITENFCEILGMLDEYISRFDYFTVNPKPHDSLVESFYPKEIKEARHFLGLIHKYEIETGLNFNVTKTIGSQGHIYVYSKLLSSLINSCYVMTSFKLATLDIKRLIDKSDELKYSYIKGAYLRYGKGNQISIANGKNKLITIKSIMESLGFHDVINYESRPEKDFCPASFILEFKSSELQKKKFKIKGNEKKIDLKDYEIIKN